LLTFLGPSNYSYRHRTKKSEKKLRTIFHPNVYLTVSQVTCHSMSMSFSYMSMSIYVLYVDYAFRRSLNVYLYTLCTRHESESNVKYLNTYRVLYYVCVSVCVLNMVSDIGSDKLCAHCVLWWCQSNTLLSPLSNLFHLFAVHLPRIFQPNISWNHLSLSIVYFSLDISCHCCLSLLV